LLRRLLRDIASLAVSSILPRARVLAQGDQALQQRDFHKATRLYGVALGKSAPPVRVYRNAFMDEGRKARNEPYVHTLRDVILDADRCAIFDADKVYIQETSTRNLVNHLGMFVRASPDLAHFAIAAPPPRDTIERRVALIGTDGHNYSHWMLFNVLKLGLLEHAGLLDGDLPLLFNDPLLPWQAEMLDFLGVPAARRLLVRPEGLLACRELVVPVVLAKPPQMRLGTQWLRERYRDRIGAQASGPRRLYVSRRSAHRNLVNRTQLETALQARGFQAVELAGKSVAEQAACFAAAEVIVSPHEAGLANLVFASPGCRVVEITNTYMVRMGMFKNLADAVGLRMERIVSDRFAEGDSPLGYRDFHVDVEAVMRAIDAG
jgi:hypothetical protein